MLAVRRVPAPAVHVVDVIPVRHGDVAAALPVVMVVMRMHGVAGRFALVVVVAVLSMQVPLVDVVDVPPVWDRDVAAPVAVHVMMCAVGVVGYAGHCLSPPSLKLLVHDDFSPCGPHRTWS